ncbi:4-(cytidine 5'-diphospho)-2-C-methyl-D-erythritol kinase [Terriglobus sp. TAA 43]|uniref:4-(cytidine 5'-diphospho)-2-C-methyl-D-erythritol kinase n=1 Tax=Terriglobus sp. TAA 43 TaxID=278961 RepID=UPI00064692A0|nr:4-diphosphocytidyl-2C-methyl-D-erythritol kinase [Terriglobus sp. TAA 43]
MSTTVRSYAKINLGLRIGPPRADGFHELHTLYQSIGLHDEVTVTAKASAVTRITMDCSDLRVPTDARNTAFRTVEMALAAMGITAEVHLSLTKNLPVQGGLGAGSANAAAALLGLERELGTALPGPQRMSLAERIGSDVPLFLLGGTVYGHNRGQIVVPYPDLPAMHCVVFAPTVGSSTPLAFKAWDEQVSRLTPEAAQDRLDELSRVYASAFACTGADSQTGASGAFGALDGADGSIRSGSLAGNPLPALVRTGIANDFEEVVFQQHPFLRDILHALKGDETLGESSAVMAALSGSGSSLFGLYRTEADAEAAQARTTEYAGRSFRTITLTRNAYWSSMFV